MMRLHQDRNRRGFTISDLLTVLITLGFVALLIGILLPARGNGGSHHQIKCAAQVREAHKGMVMWAQQNNGWYPLASKIGRDGKTVPVSEAATQLDTTGAVYSIMIYNSLVTPEVLVSPAEANPVIRADDGYEYVEPAAATAPEKARWDPAFRGTPLDDWPNGNSASAQELGNASYAHLALAGLGRRSEWQNSLSSNYAALGNRGPEETGGTWNPETGELTATTLAEGRTGKRSLTLRIHGARKTWEGNIAYNDNHVNFETTTYPDVMLYVDDIGKEARRFGDGLFLDEGDPSVLDNFAPEDTSDRNCSLGLFRRGPTREEYRDHKQAVKFIKQARWFDGMTP